MPRVVILPCGFHSHHLILGAGEVFLTYTSKTVNKILLLFIYFFKERSLLFKKTDVLPNPKGPCKIIVKYIMSQILPEVYLHCTISSSAGECLGLFHILLNTITHQICRIIGGCWCEVRKLCNIQAN